MQALAQSLLQNLICLSPFRFTLMHFGFKAQKYACLPGKLLLRET